MGITYILSQGLPVGTYLTQYSPLFIWISDFQVVCHDLVVDYKINLVGHKCPLKKEIQ